MKPYLLIKIAAIITLLYCAGHLSGLPWTPGTSDEATAVVKSMQTVSFEAEGKWRTYWDFYLGFGLIIGAFLLCSSILLWQLSRSVKVGALTGRGMITIHAIFYATNGILSLKYFFLLPAILCASIVLCLVASLALSTSQHRMR